MTQPLNISRNFAMVPEGTRRGNGDKKGLNIPEPVGNMTLTVPLDFLFRQREKMAARKGKSMLLNIFTGVEGELDPMKKRLLSYGLFGKQAQTNAKKFNDHQVGHFFVWGQNMTGYEIRKIDQAMAALCRALGDETADERNFRNSDKLQAALNEAKGFNFVVVGRYEDAFVGVDEEDDTKGFINLGYVKFGTGRVPTISAFDRPQKDGLVELEMDGKKYMDYVLDTDGSFSVITTRSYLKDFATGGGDAQNLKLLTRKSDGNQFWVVQVASYTREQLPGDFFASFSGDTLELLKSADRISFEYGLKDTDSRVIDDILAVNNGGRDAQIAFTGMISDDESRIRVYDTEPDPETGKVRRYVTMKLIRGTFFTTRLL